MSGARDNGGGRGPPLVPEAVLKRKHDMDEMAAQRAANAILNPRGNRKIVSSQKRLKVVAPEKILAEARARKNYRKRFRRVNKKGMQSRAKNKPTTDLREVVVEKNQRTGQEKTESRPYQSNSVGRGMVLAVRIRGEHDRNDVPRECGAIMKNLGLANVHDAVLLRYDDKCRKKLHLVEPFVVYGPPSQATVADLIHRRGHGRLLMDGVRKRVPLSDNVVIEQCLGEDTGIICVEDLVEEIVSVGSNFQLAVDFLWPFRLAAPKSKFQKKTLGHNAGTRNEYGDRGEAIDDVVKDMS